MTKDFLLHKDHKRNGNPPYFQAHLSFPSQKPSPPNWGGFFLGGMSDMSNLIAMV